MAITTTWDAWYPLVLPHARTAPYPLVDQAVLESARTFLKRTRAWMEWLDATPTQAGVSVEYWFELPARTEMVRLERATLNGVPLTVASYREQPTDWTTTQSGPAVVSRDLVAFNLLGHHPAAQSVQAQASLMPARDSTGLPSALASRFLDVIAEGAKGRLLLIKNTDFYAPDLAAVANAEFERGVGGHGYDVYRGHTGITPRARPKWC